MQEPQIVSADDIWLRTTCDCCLNQCGIIVHRVNGIVEKIEGDPLNPYNKGKICAKGLSGLFGLYNPDKVRAPLIRTNPEKGINVDPKWKEISWDEALNMVADRLREVHETDPRKLLVVSFDTHSTGIIQAFTHSFGSPNHTPWSADYYCGNGVHPITYLVHGSFHSEPDLKYCKYCILFGTQFGHGANENPVGGALEMADARARGMKLVVFDPVCNGSGSKADLWVPIRPGTDSAAALAILNQMISELNLYDKKFLAQYTNGSYLIGDEGKYVRDVKTGKPLVWNPETEKAVTFDTVTGLEDKLPIEGTFEITVNGKTKASPAFQVLKNHVKKYTPEYAYEISTVPPEIIRKIARDFGETASIGKTIKIKDVELPYRPVAVWWYRGPSAHKHSMLNCWSLPLLPMVVGAIDVPGGSLGYPPVNGPWWRARESSDGIILPSGVILGVRTAYPARKVVKPNSITYMELFPVAPYVPTYVALNLLHPERYKPPYTPEILIHCRANMMMTSGDPTAVEAILKKIPFQVSFSTEIDETTEFADVVIPDVNYLEKFDISLPSINRQGHGTEPWWWNIPQPVVETSFKGAPIKARSLVEVLYEIASRAGFLQEMNKALNMIFNLKGDYTLTNDVKHAWEDIADRMAKSTFGAEHDLKWFAKNGILLQDKKIDEAYPRTFVKGRIPIYLEHFIAAGEEVKKVTEEMKVEWDTSDYQAVPDWKPCPAFEARDPEYDLFVVNFKIPAHTLSSSGSNPILNKLATRNNSYAFLINTKTANAKGLRDGDTVSIETPEKKSITGVIKLTERVHPEVIGVPGVFGHWATGMPRAKGRGAHFNTLVPITAERVDYLSGALDACLRVKITKVPVEKAPAETAVALAK